MSTASKGTGKPPIIFAGTKNDKKEGLDLWENEPRPEGPPLTDTSPHMVGKAYVDGAEYPVSVWVTPEKITPGEGGKEDKVVSAYQTIKPRGVKNAAGEYVKGNYGYARAQNTADDKPFPADRNPYLQAELTIDGQKHVIRGYISKHGLDFMGDLGFTQEVEDNARELIAKKEAAKLAA
jgi:hypothetical protein